MEYAAFAFAIFGLLAYLEAASLKKRVKKLEEQLARTQGTQAYEDRLSLVQAVSSYIGKKVILEIKEDYQDMDVASYGNTKYGSNIILDADDEWILLRIVSAKGTKEKLIRVAAVARISVVE